MNRFLSRAVSVVVRSSICFGLLWSSACGDDRPGMSGGESVLPTPNQDQCGHPSPGCPCATPGASAECGAVEQVVNDQALCAMGHMQCQGDKWGA